MDKAYIDFKRLHRLHLKGSFFFTRAKDNMRFKRMYSKSIDKTTGAQCDQIGSLKTYYSNKDYPDKIRRINYFDQENNRNFVFITNNFDLEPIQIATLYMKR